MTRSLSLALLATGVLAGSASAQLTAWGVTNDGRLVSFDTSAPGVLLSDVAISGLNTSELVRGIDARPASVTGDLVIVTSENRLMSLGFDGTATAIGTGFTPAAATTNVGFDFNPTVDRIRFVGTDGFNRRLNPVNGANAALDTALTYTDGPAIPRAVGTAYNSFQFGVGAPVGSIRQYIIDSERDVLGEVGSQAGGNASFNGGIVTPRANLLGFDLTDDAGFDVFGPTQMAFVSNLSGGVATFYSLSLGSGIATSIGTVGAAITDFTVIPTPGAASLLGLGAIAAFRRRR
ncbi:MAG: DUF4394 domain-containing protein [Phycisphaerales bacterium]